MVCHQISHIYAELRFRRQCGTQLWASVFLWWRWMWWLECYWDTPRSVVVLFLKARDNNCEYMTYLMYNIIWYFSLQNIVIIYVRFHRVLISGGILSFVDWMYHILLTCSGIWCTFTHGRNAWPRCGSRICPTYDPVVTDKLEAVVAVEAADAAVSVSRCCAHACSV